MRSTLMLRPRQTSLLLGLLGLTAHAMAGEFTYSGFATVAVGKVLGGSNNAPLNTHFDCPCYIADYGQGAVYEREWSLGQESKLGVQGTYKFTPSLSATGQVVARGVDGVKADVEWAFLSYEASPNWTLQAGRKRLPMYFFSDFQDVGYAYNWVRPPIDLYGWEIVNYNGVNATYRGDWGGWSAKSNLFTGREDSKKNRYSKIYWDNAQDVTWKGIMGADLELTRNWLTLRFNYITSKVQQWDHTDGSRVTPDPSSDKTAERQHIYGVAMNIDYNNWLMRSEYSVFDRSSYSYRSRAFMVSAGYRVGDFIPSVTYSRYGEHNSHSPDIQRDEGLALTVRYDINDTSDIKVQFDRFRDRSTYDFVGHAKQITVSYDTVF